MEIDCKTCASYGLYKMVTSGNPYGYSGDIPCLHCCHFRVLNDQYTQITEKKLE